MGVAEEVLVGHITSDVIDDVYSELSEPLVPAYLKTTSNGFLTAAYAYNGEYVRAFVCSPADGRWRRVHAFEPQNPVSVSGKKEETKFTFYGSDADRAAKIEQIVFDELDGIYEYSVTETSLFEAQLEIARDDCTCTSTERATLTVPLVEERNIYPIVCKRCMRVHNVSYEGKKRGVSEFTEGFGDSPLKKAVSFEEEVALGVHWYSKYREKPESVVGLENKDKWLIIGNGGCVGYFLTEQSDNSVRIVDLFVGEGSRDKGHMSDALNVWANKRIENDTVFCDVDVESFQLIREAIDKNCIRIMELSGFELGQERVED